MSYELISEKTIPCPCGEGRIIETTSQNEWNQFRPSVLIECPVCSKIYSLQSRYVIHGDHTVEFVYLVPRGESIMPVKDSTDIKTFSEWLSVQYSLDILTSVYNHLIPITNSKNIKNYEAKKIARDCKRETGTMKVSALISHLQEAIQYYDSYETNWIKEHERINEVISRSILLPF